jgi:hypothetical protein
VTGDLPQKEASVDQPRKEAPFGLPHKEVSVDLPGKKVTVDLPHKEVSVDLPRKEVPVSQILYTVRTSISGVRHSQMGGTSWFFRSLIIFLGKRQDRMSKKPFPTTVPFKEG